MSDRRQERIRSAVIKLRAAARSGGIVAAVARAEALQTLRSFGFTEQQRLEARAHAFDGHSTEQILEVLSEREVVSA